MLNWADEIYCSKGIRNPGTIKMLIERGNYDLGLFLIALSSNEKDQLDIIALDELYKEEIRKRLGLIIGLAATNAESYEVIAAIADEVYSLTGGYDMRGYFAEKYEGAL